MNENPGETPNPLGTAPGAATANTNPAPKAPASSPASPVEAPAASQVATPAPTNPADRPMEQAPAPAPVEQPKKKTGLIIGIIVGVVLLVGACAAAVIALTLNKGDAVTAAMSKIMSGQAPSNVAVDGTIDMIINDEDSPIEKVKISLQSGLMQDPLVNTSSAVVTLSVKQQDDVSFEFNEAYSKDGDLYLKLEGLTDALDDSNLLYYMSGGGLYEPVDCTVDEEGNEICDEDSTENTISDDTAGMFDSFLTVFDTIDGKWLRISADEMNDMTNGAISDSHVSCITNLVSDLNKNSASTIELYQQYPFIISDSKNVTVQSKNDPIYRVSLDSKGFANFVNSIQNSEITKNLYSCLDFEGNVSVDSEDIDEILEEFPVIYTEVNSQNNFTRLYLESESEDGNATVIIDLAFTYPDNLNINEPDEYVDFSEIIQEIMSSMYELPDSTTNADVDTTE